MVQGIQFLIQGSKHEAASSNDDKRFNWYNMSLMDKRDDTYRYVVLVQSEVFVEGPRS